MSNAVDDRGSRGLIGLAWAYFASGFVTFYLVPLSELILGRSFGLALGALMLHQFDRYGVTRDTLTRGRVMFGMAFVLEWVLSGRMGLFASPWSDLLPHLIPMLTVAALFVICAIRLRRLPREDRTGVEVALP